MEAELKKDIEIHQYLARKREGEPPTDAPAEKINLQTVSAYLEIGIPFIM